MALCMCIIKQLPFPTSSVTINVQYVVVFLVCQYLLCIHDFCLLSCLDMSPNSFNMRTGLSKIFVECFAQCFNPSVLMILLKRMERKFNVHVLPVAVLNVLSFLGYTCMSANALASSCLILIRCRNRTGDDGVEYVILPVVENLG